MDIKAVQTMALDKVTNWVLGGELFDFIKKQVAIMVDVDIPGSEKRELVIDAAKEFFADAAKVLIAIGIEVAYFILKENMSKSIDSSASTEVTS